MLEGVVVVALVGLLLGMQFRVPALLCASALLVCGIALAGVLSGWSLAATAAQAVCLTIELQVCYAAGLGLAVGLVRRVRRSADGTGEPPPAPPSLRG